jgi:hypothetical protein
MGRVDRAEDRQTECAILSSRSRRPCRLTEKVLGRDPLAAESRVLLRPLFGYCACKSTLKALDRPRQLDSSVPKIVSAAVQPTLFGQLPEECHDPSSVGDRRALCTHTE